MARQKPSRRQLLAGSVVAIAGSAGCLSATPTDEATTETGTPPERLTELSVADFFQYLLSGTHPTVHRKAGQQYVVVRLERGARNHMTLYLDGEAVDRASREPVKEDDTVTAVFAVSKDRTVERGELRLGGSTFRTLPPETISRLNEPPVFEVGEPSVSPAEIEPEQRTEVTVTFTVTNHGEGTGTFGASLSGPASGSDLVRTTLDPGEERELSPTTTRYGGEEQARVWLDWGVDRWSTEIPVTATETPSTASE
ncbi:hypothetical protein JCM30237_15080 [Halolamina litorea]|uniref:CARDB protein n=1 Tax=Halolamina litorea TaxID=1515593 RepID=A0ABD6BNF6_9EURY|nr:hypothetical protein [Halolamina litorea]